MPRWSPRWPRRQLRSRFRPDAHLIARRARDLSWCVRGTTLGLLEDELRRERDAEQRHGEDLLRLNQEGDGDGLILIHPERGRGRGVRGLEHPDVAWRRP